MEFRRGCEFLGTGLWMVVSYQMGARNWIQVLYKCNIAHNCWPTSPGSINVLKKIYFEDYLLFCSISRSFYMFLCVPCACSAGGSQQRVWDFLKLENLPATMWILGMEPETSGRTASVPYHWAISLSMNLLKRGNIFIRYSILQRDNRPWPSELITYTRRQTSISAATGCMTNEWRTK